MRKGVMEPKEMLCLLTSLAQDPKGTISDKQRYSLSTMRKCRTYEMGGQVLECPNCKTKVIHYNPCNKRGCPICNQKSQLKWLNSARQRILPTRHYHLTFSIPGSYTPLWLKRKKDVAEALFAAAKESVHMLSAEQGLLAGSLLVFQSHGNGMSYKPHIHCLLSDGGLDSKGTYRKLGNIPTRHMSEVFEQSFEKSLGKRTCELGEEVMDASDKGYRIYVGIHENGGEQILEYLARKRFGIVVDLEDEVSRDGETIRIRERTSGGKLRETRLGVDTFLDRYMNHIPPDHFVVARYCGLYSNRHQEEFKKAREQVQGQNERVIEPWWEPCPVCEMEMKVVLVFTKEDIGKIEGLCNTVDPPEHGSIIL